MKAKKQISNFSIQATAGAYIIEIDPSLNNPNMIRMDIMDNKHFLKMFKSQLTLEMPIEDAYYLAQFFLKAADLALKRKYGY